jgi:hypothetical protein
MMRTPILFALVLALSACGDNDQTDRTQNIDENLSAENIVSNDVTAIDAVTGDAANMAADVDMNFGNLEQPGANLTTNEPVKAPRPSSTPRPTKPAAAEATQNSVTNAE